MKTEYIMQIEYNNNYGCYELHINDSRDGAVIRLPDIEPNSYACKYVESVSKLGRVYLSKSTTTIRPGDVAAVGPEGNVEYLDGNINTPNALLRLGDGTIVAKEYHQHDTGNGYSKTYKLIQEGKK